MTPTGGRACTVPQSVGPRSRSFAPTGSLRDDRADCRLLPPALQRRVVNLVSVDPTAVVVWLAGLATDWQQRRRHVRVMVHRAFFQVPDAPECFFIKVTNLSSSREIEVTHLWFATEPRVEVLNQERRASSAAASRRDVRDLDPGERRPGRAPRRVQGPRTALKRQCHQVQAR